MIHINKLLREIEANTNHTTAQTAPEAPEKPPLDAMTGLIFLGAASLLAFSLVALFAGAN